MPWSRWGVAADAQDFRTEGNIPIPFNWESSCLYEFGVTRKLPRGFSISAGYVYSENSVPNESFNPLIPDGNRHIISGGIGRTYDRFNWQLAYQYTYGPHRMIDNGTLANGDYSFKSHAVTFAIGYRF